MTGEQVIESFENSWKALNDEYRNHPDDSKRQALNMLSSIIGKVKKEVQEQDKKNQDEQLSIEDFINFFNQN